MKNSAQKLIKKMIIFFCGRYIAKIVIEISKINVLIKEEVNGN